MTSPLPAAVLVACVMLAVAMAALWAPRFTRATGSDQWWVAPFAVALVAALVARLVDARGLVAIAALVAACRIADHAVSGWWRGVGLALMFVLSAGILMHVVPGFTNLRILDGVRLSPDAQPYVKYINFDKGVLGVLLLGSYAPSRTRRQVPAGTGLAAFGHFAAAATVVIALTVAAGYARWDPKLPAILPVWLASMVCLTALPEEALFRHVIQGGLHAGLGESSGARWLAAVGAAALFGLAHLAGGWIYVGLATVAGLGYGLVYALARSIGAAIAAHTVLNLLHLLFFTYPALAAAP